MQSPLTFHLQTFADGSARAGFVLFVCAGTFLASKVVLAFAMLCGAVYLVYDIVGSGGRIGAVLLVFMLGVFLSYPLVLLNNGFSSGFMHGGLVLGSAGVALYFARTRRAGMLSVTLFALLAYYLLSVLVVGRPTDAAFLGSHNRVSTLFLGLGVLLLAIRRSPRDTAVAALIVLACVVAGGSSGILGAVLLFGVVAVRQALEPGQHAWLVRFALAGAVIALTAVVWSLMSEEALTKLALDRIIGGDVRYQIIRSYADRNLQGLNLFAGTKLVYAFEVSDSGTLMTLANLHNSYLSAHSKTGIFSIIVIGAIVFRLLVLMRRAPYLAGLLLVLLGRAFSDTVFILDGTYNFALLYFLVPLGLLELSSPDGVDQERQFSAVPLPPSAA